MCPWASVLMSIEQWLLELISITGLCASPHGTSSQVRSGRKIGWWLGTQGIESGCLGSYSASTFHSSITLGSIYWFTLWARFHISCKNVARIKWDVPCEGLRKCSHLNFTLQNWNHCFFKIPILLALCLAHSYYSISIWRAHVIKYTDEIFRI